MAIITGQFADNIKLLKSEASKAAYQGVAIAIIAIIIATAMVCYLATGTLSLEGLWDSQKHNPALWVLNFVPFVFGFWGQYASTLITYKAGAMVIDQTEELRIQAGSLEKQSAYLSTHDQLTGLPNRALFYDRVNKAIQSAGKPDNEAQGFSILLIEIENFKDVYDTLGRNSGDLIIKQIAERLQEVSLAKDLIAKIDGNMFGVMLPSVQNSSRVEGFAIDVLKAMEPPFLIGRLFVGINLLIGIVHFPEHGDYVDSLVQKAGIALHMAQQSTKGYAFYETSQDKQKPLRLTLMSDLRHAIVRGGLELFYQPQVAIKTGQVSGVEALLRWNHPEHGYIPPDELIQMAERNKIFQLTQWVLKRAFLDCANWRKQGMLLRVSVNLSAKDLHNRELPDFISRLAAETSIKPEWIMLEITERSLMSEPESALTVVQKLHEMGYQFSIDNYGTGFSSLAYLTILPLTELKIDRSFVANIMITESVAVIVKATVNLAHNLGLTVTANGIESEDILNRLLDYGCDVAQGYFLSKPLSVEQFNEWLPESQWKIANHESS